MQNQRVAHVHRLPDLQALQLAARPEDVDDSWRRRSATGGVYARRSVQRIEQRRCHVAFHRVFSVRG